MDTKKGNSRAPAYTKVQTEPEIGTTVCGFKLIAKFKHFNLWERNRPGTRKYRTCFYRNTVPNERAARSFVDE